MPDRPAFRAVPVRVVAAPERVRPDALAPDALLPVFDVPDPLSPPPRVPPLRAVLRAGPDRVRDGVRDEEAAREGAAFRDAMWATLTRRVWFV